MQGYCLVLVFVVRAPVFFPFCISIFGTQPKQRTTFILSIALGLVLLCFALSFLFHPGKADNIPQIIYSRNM